MANKVGRPKAKVSITFSEDELKTLIIGMQSSAFEMSESFYDLNAHGLQVFGKEVLMLSRLRSIHESKYGEKNGD